MFKLHLGIIISLIAILVYDGLVFVAHSQDQSGFISLNCGLPENSSFTEESTKIKYISDAAFINSGESKSILPEYRKNLQRQAITLRSFPQGTRNCYKITSTKRGTKYLIRATFLYGNYDGKNETPKFDIHLGVNFADTVQFGGVSWSVVKEVIHLPASKYVRLCLVNTGSGTPFINALELRPLSNTTYEAQPGDSLGLLARMDVGSNTTVRYPDDIYDRLWIPYGSPDWKEFSTSETVQPLSPFDLPNKRVANDAATPADANSPFRINFEATNINAGFYVYMHFAEIQKLGPNESRSFDIKVNGRLWYGPVIPLHLTSVTVFSRFPVTGELTYNFTLEKLKNSTLPPIVSAVEIYTLMKFSQIETDENDVDAMMSIKSIYGVTRNWDGDPCLPVNYTWTGLNCSVDGSNPPRITSLDLSSSGLSGEIPVPLANLNMLDSLDLSNNNLTGSVPNFLSKLPNLRTLNLAKNKLTGVVPAELIERSNDGSLTLIIDDNQDLCASSHCKKKKKKKSTVVPVVASVGGSFFALLIAGAIFLGIKKKKKQGQTASNHKMGSFECNKRPFTYSEIVSITKNFGRILGKGGFATVYHGVLNDGTEVAVKKINNNVPAPDEGSQVITGRRNKDEAKQQYQQYQAEVKLLLTVYHGNLTSLVGYCNQGTNRLLIYEFMANGDLESHLSGKQQKVLSWETRLQIAIDSAQGLEYLHNGCKPAIIHRDIKTANILITDNFRAKIADFGLSKFFLTDDGTHVSTMHLVGTHGYIDPDLASGGLLSEKSDVYSFGVVLLQIITSRPTRSKVNEDEWVHLSSWVRLMLDNGNIKDIVDEHLRGDFEINSAWKAVEIAMACISMPGINRPNMVNVVTELRQCLAMEQSRKNSFLRTSTDSSHDLFSLPTIVESRPLAR